jgi:hypothetical protein
MGDWYGLLFSWLISGAVLTVSLQTVKFYCTPSQLVGNGTCPVTTGEDVLRLYDFDVNTLAYSFSMLACLVLYRMIAYGVLRLKLRFWKFKR